MRWIKKLIIWFYKVLLALWKIVKSMKGWKGVTSLVISFMLFAGWAYIMAAVGWVIGNTWMMGVGAAVILFWIGPFTPLFGIVIAFALIIQRFVFLDKSISWQNIKEKFREAFRKEEKIEN